MSLERTESHGLLVAPLQRLVHQLRASGVSVSSSEMIDAANALREVDLLDKRQVRGALAATLIKQTEDLRSYELLFELYFANQQMPRAVQQETETNGARQHMIQTSLDRVTFDGAGDADEAPADLLSMIMEALRRGDAEALRALADMAVREYGGIGTQPNATERYFLYRVLRALELSKLMADVLAAERDSGSGVDERQLRADLAERIDAFKQLLATAIRGQLAEERGADETSRMLELLGTEDVDFLGRRRVSSPRCARRSVPWPVPWRPRSRAAAAAGTEVGLMFGARYEDRCLPVACPSTPYFGAPRSLARICMCCATFPAQSPSLRPSRSRSCRL